MLKRNRFGKKIRRFRKPNMAVLALASLTVILLLAWGALYWQGRSTGTAVAQGNDGSDLPVIMLDLDAPQEQMPQGGEPGKGNEPEEAGAIGGEGAGNLLEDLKNSPGGLLGMEEGWPNLPNTPQGADGSNKEDPLPTSGAEPPANSGDDDAEQIPGGASPKPTPSPASTPSPSPTERPEPEPVVTDKPTASPAPSEKPAATPSPAPSTAPTPDEPDVDMEQQYELELLGLQAGCIMDVKSVLQEAESKDGKADPSDFEALQRIGAEAAASLEAAGAACESKFNEVAAKAGQDGVSADKIGEWRQTYNEVMEQLRAEAELKLQQLLGM